MTSTLLVKIDKELVDILYNIQKEVADKIKKEYNIEKITIHGTVASRILAKKFSGKNNINFKIRKISLTEGILEVS